MKISWFRWSFVGRLLALLVVVAMTACQTTSPAPTAPPKAADKAPAGAAAPAPTSAPAAKPAEKTDAAAKPAAPASAGRSSKELQKVRISYSAVTAFQSLSWVAKDRGLFEKYGLDAEVTQIATVEQISALNAGKVDIGITSADNIASAMLSGADLKMIGLFVPYIEAAFYGRPEIKTPQDLKGKLVGASTAGPGIIRRSNEVALQKLGLDPNKDVETRVFRTTTDAFAAARAGEIQAISLVPPDDRAAAKAGFNLLYDVAKDRVVYPSGSTYASNKYIREHPDLVQAYINAMSEGIAVYKSDPELRSKRSRSGARLKIEKVIKAGWDFFARDIPDVPKWNPEAMKATLDALSYELEKAKTADPASFYNNSFVEQAEKDGLYADLAKRYPKKLAERYFLA